jgi:hypothetical protein
VIGGFLIYVLGMCGGQFIGRLDDFISRWGVFIGQLQLLSFVSAHLSVKPFRHPSCIKKPPHKCMAGIYFIA